MVAEFGGRDVNEEDGEGLFVNVVSGEVYQLVDCVEDSSSL